PRAALPGRDPLPARRDRGCLAAARARGRPTARRGGISQQSGPGTRRRGSRDRGDRRVSCRALAQARPRPRMEQSRARAAGAKRSSRRHRRLPARARDRPRLCACALESLAGAPPRWSIRRGLARLRCPARVARARPRSPSFSRTVMEWLGASRQDAARVSRAGPRRRGAIRALCHPYRCGWSALPGIAWFSLQQGEHAAQIAATRGAENIVPLPEGTPLVDTAALLAELDLIITVDTSIAHLAGALGRPAWVLLPFAPDWRWQLV